MTRCLAIFLVLALAAPLATADKWPQHGRPSTHAKLAKRVSSTIKRAYKLKRVTRRDGGPSELAWRGPEVGLATRSALGSAQHQLTAANLAYNAQRGREPIDVLAGIAISLGIEQGQRMVKTDPRLQSALMLLRSAAATSGAPGLDLALELLEQALEPSATP